MSPKLKNLSGNEVIKILESFGFNVVGQKGSHIKLVRHSTAGIKEVLLVPDHKLIAKGTQSAIIRQASAYIPREELEKKCR